ncbi:MAG: hypothetical protein HOW73_30200 [Polyangiaceae bacterium]|nr:hypothetical protein [Polyangiaceae bacterium]
MKDHSKARLANVADRFGRRIQAADHAARPDLEAFCSEFRRVRDATIIPAMRDVGEELLRQSAGGRPIGNTRYAIEIEDQPAPGREAPSVTLRLFLTPRAPHGHRITFTVITRDAVKGPEILAFLEASPPPMDIARFRPDDLTEGVVEQLIVDAVEQIYACAAELPAKP